MTDPTLIKITLWLLCPFIAAFLADWRGGSSLLGAILGLLLGPVGIVISLMVGGRTCPACRSRVYRGATKCRRCQEALA